MPRRLAASAIACLIACGQSSSSGSAPEAGSSSTGLPSTDSSSSSDGADESTTAVDTADTWDQSQCSEVITGQPDWSSTVVTTVAVGGGQAIARGVDGDLFVVDGCLSRWEEDGLRQWLVSDPSWTCNSMVLDAQGHPIVAGHSLAAYGRVPLLHSYDAERELKWKATFEDSPLTDDVATDLAIDRWGELVLVGRRSTDEPGEAPDQSWVTKFDENGQALWSLSFDEGVSAPPKVAVDGDGGIVHAEQRRTDNGIEYVVLLGLDAQGKEVWSWDSLVDLGSPLRLLAMDADPQGEVVLAGRDPTPPHQPDLIVLLGRGGNVRWSRSSIDIGWLETIATVAFDPCGSIVFGGGGDLGPRNWGQPWIAKVDRQAELRWGHYVAVPLVSQFAQIQGVRVEPDGGVLATGTRVIAEQIIDEEPVPVLESWMGRVLP
ncbi:MAG: hypothetical protein AAF799_06455 [Myxococcota bacterium]